MSFSSFDDDSSDTAPADGEEAAVDRWDVPGDAAPCAVYSQGPGMGRVTTPLGDLSFTNLFGSQSSMLRQLGRHSAGELREGALPFINQFGADVVDALVPRPVAALGNWALDNWLINRLQKALPSPYLKMLRAYADGSGHEVERVVAGQFAWEIWALLAHSSMSSVEKAASRARRHSPLLGSTSVVLPSANSGPLHLRWLDNTAIDRWDRKTSVTFFHPDRGIPYVFVSSLGFLTGLPAGMNAAGLTLTVEPCSGDTIDWSGVPMGPAAHDILSQAHTIEEAAALLAQRPAMTSWRYVICEGDTGRAQVFVSGAGVEPSEGVSEPPFSAGCSDAGVPGCQSARVKRWMQGRQRVVDGFTHDWSGHGKDAVFRALRAMTEAVPAGENSVTPGHPLNGLGNVGALLFEPRQRRLWVAAGRAPVANRWFVPLTFRAADGRSGGGLDGRVRPIKPALDWEKTNPGRAMEHLRHAFQLEHSGEEEERILITLEHALALDAKCASHHILVGLMALRAGRGRRAQGAFEQALGLLHDAVRSAEVGVYRAWSLDLQRKRREARKAYRALVKAPSIENAARRWARRGRRRRFRRRDIRAFDIDFFLAAAFER